MYLAEEESHLFDIQIIILLYDFSVFPLDGFCRCSASAEENVFVYFELYF